MVNADAPSPTSPLTDEQIASITADERLQFIHEGREIQAAASNELPRHELWQLLFLAFLALLVGEVLLTRKLVRRACRHGCLSRLGPLECQSGHRIIDSTLGPYGHPKNGDVAANI